MIQVNRPKQLMLRLMVAAASMGLPQTGRTAKTMDKLPQSKPPQLIKDVTAPVSPSMLSSMSIVEGGLMAVPEKVIRA